MSYNGANPQKPNLVTLLPDLSNYTDWEDMMVCYMRARECYYAVNPDDEFEKELLELRKTAAEGDQKLAAVDRIKEIRANAEALSIIRQWRDASHRPKIRRCNKASDAWAMLRPMRNQMTADLLTGKFHDLKVEDFDKATTAMNALQEIMHEIYATGPEAEKEFPQTAAVRMAVSKLPLEPYKQFKYDCFKPDGMPKSMNELIMRLMEQEQWSTLGSGTQEESRSAFWTDKTNSGADRARSGSERLGRRRGRPRNNITCWTCGKKGHFHYECGNNNRAGNTNTFNGGLSAVDAARDEDDDKPAQEVYWRNPNRRKGPKQAHFAFSASEVVILGHDDDVEDCLHSDSGHKADDESDDDDEGPSCATGKCVSDVESNSSNHTTTANKNSSFNGEASRHSLA